MTSTLPRSVVINFGGKPSRGTRKDRRLRENQHVGPHDGTKPGGTGDGGDGGDEAAQMDCPDGQDCTEHADAMTHEFGSSNTVSDSPWNGAASNFTDAQYQNSCAACDPGDATVKERCFLPHHDPGGALNRSGLGKAAGRAGQLSGHDPGAVSRAKAHLRGHYSAIGEDPPPQIAAAIDWHLRSFADTGGAPPAAGPPDIRGPLVVEGKETGDGREFAPGSITWPQPGEAPMILQWQKETSHGSDHDVTVAVGVIDNAWRADNGLIMGEARFDTHDDAVEAKRRNAAGMLQGISINADDITDADVEYVLPEPDGSSDGGDWIDLLFARPAKTIFHAGRIRAATLCDTPAFVEAVMAPVTDGQSLAPEPGPAHALTADDRPGLVASSPWDVTWRPHRSWFEDPGLQVPTPVTITDEGRLFGLVSEWSECHLGYTGECMLPPRDDDFAHFMTGARPVHDGATLTVGMISGGIGHADIYWSAAKATQHYDNTAAQVAVVRVGTSKIGIWCAGAVVPWASEDNVEGLRSTGQVSPDWRWIGGRLKMVGLLAVTSSGFQTPMVRQFVAGGQVRTLITSGFTSVGRRPPAEPDEESLDRRAMLALMRRAAASLQP